MQRFGAETSSENKEEYPDIFLARLQLIIVMLKAFLNGLPIGKHRKQAVIENAQTLFYMSLLADHTEAGSDRVVSAHTIKNIKDAKCFHKKVQLLSVMAKAFAEGRLVGEKKRKDLQGSIDSVCEMITFNDRIDDIGFINVA